MRQRKAKRPLLPPRPSRRKERDAAAAERHPDLFPAIPSRVEDLRGMRFGGLYVRAYAGQDRDKSAWCCECDCGSLCKVTRDRLLGTKGASKQVSCGCRKQDPAVQRAARLKVPAARRREIAAKASAAVQRRVSPYAMSESQAARALRCEPEDVRKMAESGELRTKEREGKLCYSAEDVRRWSKLQRRNSRHCRALEPQGDDDAT